jgi:hypothetical protein
MVRKFLTKSRIAIIVDPAGSDRITNWRRYLVGLNVSSWNLAIVT